MTDLLPYLVHSAVTNAMIMLLIFSLARPKRGRAACLAAVLAACLLDSAVNALCYYRNEQTLVVYVTMFEMIPALLLTKFLFYDSCMQWCFNIITALNIHCVARLLARGLSACLPYPDAGVIAFRVLLLGGVSWAFYRHLRSLYAQVQECWGQYMLASLSLLLAFGYIMVIYNSLPQYWTFYALISAVTVCFYVSLFWSLRALSEKYALREENQRIKVNDRLLRASANAMAQRLALMDALAAQSRILRHDQRHFDAALLELLRAGKSEEASRFLERRAASGPVQPKNWCENHAANAAATFWLSLAECEGIRCEASLDIPRDPGVDSLELSMALSNLLENAVHGCQALPPERRWLRVAASCAGQLLLSVENSCAPDVKLDERGLPAAEEGGGVGTQSVLAFAERACGEALYDISDGVFRVRLML